MTNVGSEVLAKLVLLSMTFELVILARWSGEEAGRSGGPVFPAEPWLKLALGMEDKHGVTQAACSDLLAHIYKAIH